MIDIQHYMEVNDREFEVVLGVHMTPFRKGDGWGAYHGPTPDEPEEAIVEQIFLKGKKHNVELCSWHRFFDLVPDEAELFDLINEHNFPEYPEDLC